MTPSELRAEYEAALDRLADAVRDSDDPAGVLQWGRIDTRLGLASAARKWRLAGSPPDGSREADAMVEAHSKVRVWDAVCERVET